MVPAHTKVVVNIIASHGPCKLPESHEAEKAIRATEE
jgi:hypothetical protein